MTTLKELKEIENFNDYAAVEMYRPSFDNNDNRSYAFKTDFIDYCDDAKDEEEVIRWQSFGEDEYNNSINANNSLNDDFEELYGNKNAKVLVILIKRGK